MIKNYNETLNCSKTQNDIIQNLLKEILKMSEEIIEGRRKLNPDTISTHPSPYPDELQLVTDYFSVVIQFVRYAGFGDSRDYNCSLSMFCDDLVDTILFFYDSDGKPSCSVESWEGKFENLWAIREYFIIIHRAFLEIAKNEGIDFVSVIDYDEISSY